MAGRAPNGAAIDAGVGLLQREHEPAEAGLLPYWQFLLDSRRVLEQQLLYSRVSLGVREPGGEAKLKGLVAASTAAFPAAPLAAAQWEWVYRGRC